MRKIWNSQNDNLDVSADFGFAATKGALASKPEVPSTSIVFMLLPGFSLLSLTSFLTVFDNLNAIVDARKFNWSFASDDGKAVKCSLGFERTVTQCFTDVKPAVASSHKADLVVVLGGRDVEQQCSYNLSRSVRLLRRQRVPLVALGSATCLFAEMGVLQNTMCTIHWDKLAAFIETFEGTRATDAIFVEDEGIWSCAGELSAFDLAIRIVEREVGSQYTEHLCRRSVADRPRSGASRQVKSAWLALGGINDKLVKAIQIMEQHVNDPLDLQSVADRLNVSRRQLERLFTSYVGSSPHKFYLKLRLDRARQLIVQTRMPLVDIAIACGFVSTSHFSKSFREYFGVTPTGTRRSNGEQIEGGRIPSRLLCA